MLTVLLSAQWTAQLMRDETAQLTLHSTGAPHLDATDPTAWGNSAESCRSNEQENTKKEESSVDGSPVDRDRTCIARAVEERAVCLGSVDVKGCT